MTEPSSDALDPLDRALAQLHRLVGGVAPQQRHAPTPCRDWDVTDLARHVIGSGLPNFAAAARGESVDWSATQPQDVGEDWESAFDAGARSLSDAWRAAVGASAPDSADGPAPWRTRLDQQIAEFTIHGWDLARATGTPDATLDDDLAERALTWSRTMLRPEYRGPDKAFGHEVPVGPGATAYERVAAWFGRDPAWAAPCAPVSAAES